MRPFFKKRVQSLRPLAIVFEKLQMILGSCASSSVVPRNVGRNYEVVRSEAALAGVRYEKAHGNEIPNFGEKLMSVVTREDSRGGLRCC